MSAWLRLLRPRFLFASVISVAAGLCLAWSHGVKIDALDAALTLAGVIALHASVDLLNDYWDHKRGIDAQTIRTPMSGGTGVLPEGAISPESVRRAGIISMVMGASIGGYFVFTDGIIIAAILGFAVVSVYFYSTRIVDSGLSEVFVGAKGALIVMGTYLIQAPSLTAEAVLTGAVIGSLSSTVLYVTSFPDYEADKAHGRKSLVILLGRYAASRVYWVFLSVTYGLVLAGTYAGILPIESLISLGALPLAVKSGLLLAEHHNEVEGLIPAMSGVILYARITGALVAAGFVISATT